MSETLPITRDSTIARAEHLVSSMIGDEVVMLDADKGAYYGLDAIGSCIWQHLMTPLSVSALCDRLLPQYQVSRQDGETDVVAFLNDLHDNGIICVVAPVQTGDS